MILKNNNKKTHLGILDLLKKCVYVPVESRKAKELKRNGNKRK
jgi:hypothetical protein